jgi:TatD DNase family protein
MAVFYDTHAHLGYPELSAELPDLLRRAHAAGIDRIITIGTDRNSSERCIELAEQHAELYAAIGWHPSDAMEAPADIRPFLRERGAHPKVVALGETGLDYYRLPGKAVGGNTPEDLTIKERQAELFRQHLEVAAELKLNCVIHTRDSLEDTLSALEPFSQSVRGVFHCFANDAAAMQRIVAMNSLVSFTGILTFKNGQNIRDTLQATPLDKFMLETDSPYLAPVPYRGKRCEPAYVLETAKAAAEVKQCSLEELSQATCDTARTFFRGLE